ncbi:hypothetical protein ACFXPR_18840 [Nocardia tengchongensis]|uniref:effector-associated constant component EACC1 n=1 Tax=Nocardia tengchongensis TaxID=2055889 RepID=UPI00368AD8B8
MREFRLSIEDSDDDAALLRDLYEAIRDDYELTGVRTSLVPASVPEGKMGAEEILRLVLDHSSVDLAVCGVISAWIAARRARRLKLIVRSDGTAELEINGDNKPAADEIVRLMRAAQENSRDETAGQ